MLLNIIIILVAAHRRHRAPLYTLALKIVVVWSVIWSIIRDLIHFTLLSFSSSQSNATKTVLFIPNQFILEKNYYYLIPSFRAPLLLNYNNRNLYFIFTTRILLILNSSPTDLIFR